MDDAREPSSDQDWSHVHASDDIEADSPDVSCVADSGAFKVVDNSAGTPGADTAGSIEATGTGVIDDSQDLTPHQATSSRSGTDTTGSPAGQWFSTVGSTWSAISGAVKQVRFAVTLQPVKWWCEQRCS